jgi:AraC-like DNA-binding protein
MVYDDVGLFKASIKRDHTPFVDSLMDINTKVVPAPYIRRLLEVCNEQGSSNQQLLDGTRLTIDEITTAGSRITHAQQMQIYTNVTRLLPEPGISLRACKTYRAHDFGVYGLAVQTSSNFHQATELAARFVALAGGYADNELLITNEEYRIRVTENHPLPGAHQFVIDEIICGLHASLSHLVDQPVPALRVTLDYPASGQSERYREFFGCPVQFSSPYSELIYPKAYGKIPVKYYDLDANEACVQRCDQLLQNLREAEDMKGKVRKALLQLSSYRRNAEEVADRLHISPRHLRRVLSEEETSFQAVFDEVRFELAKSYLGESVFSVEQMTPLIGFTEPNSFRRAFKKWSGISPTEYRNQL